MTRTRLLFVAYLIFVWWMFRPGHANNTAPAAWHTAGRTAGALAHFFGSIALACEARYWRAVGA